MGRVLRQVTPNTKLAKVLADAAGIPGVMDKPWWLVEADAPRHWEMHSVCNCTLKKSLAQWSPQDPTSVSVTWNRVTLMAIRICFGGRRRAQRLVYLGQCGRCLRVYWFVAPKRHLGLSPFLSASPF
jgi:hypothetical protein